MPERASSDREVRSLAERVLALEAEHPRHVALAHLLAEQRPLGSAQLPLYVGWKAAGVPRRTFYSWVSSGRLKASKVGRMLLAKRTDVERLMVELEVAERPTAPAQGASADLVALAASGKVALQCVG